MHDLPSTSELLKELAEFGASLSQLVDTQPVDWDRRPGDEEWSMTEVLCHLRDVEREVHQIRFHRLLELDNAFLSGENPDAWVEVRQYDLQDGPFALAEFLEERNRTVSLLEGIEDDALWERKGRHAFFGLTSMQELVNLAVRHDRAHWAQILSLTGQQPESSS